jgi:4-hydroxy-2-oxoheptanedioate aldolase
MNLPPNGLKRALREGKPQIGLWLGMANSYVAEVLATTGFDWLLIDCEHAPNDLRGVLRQMQAIAPYPVHPVVRLSQDDVTLIKQYLDIGAQTLLVPMVESAEQAERIVAATRYPPEGVRGVGSALARASRWSQVDGYLQACTREICVLLQVESTNGMSNVAAIAAVEGVDGIFFGPSDLAASMGHLGRASHPEVQASIDEGIRLVARSGKAAGILTLDRNLARHYLSIGASFVGVGIDTTLLVHAARDLAAVFKQNTATQTAP